MFHHLSIVWQRMALIPTPVGGGKRTTEPPLRRSKQPPAKRNPVADVLEEFESTTFLEAER
jgi:hypothetical protein